MREWLSPSPHLWNFPLFFSPLSHLAVDDCHCIKSNCLKATQTKDEFHILKKYRVKKYKYKHEPELEQSKRCQTSTVTDLSPHGSANSKHPGNFNPITLNGQKKQSRAQDAAAYCYGLMSGGSTDCTCRWRAPNRMTCEGKHPLNIL